MTNPLSIDLIAAARPNFMKIAPLYHALAARVVVQRRASSTRASTTTRTCRTRFSPISACRSPHVHLNVGSGSHAEQTGRVMIEYEKVCAASRPDWIVVVGDVNSTLACALVGAKLLIPVAHLEAGLRSGDRTMPEEINRLVTDAIADLLWTPSPDGDEHLAREGVAGGRRSSASATSCSIRSSCSRRRFARPVSPRELGVAKGSYGVVTLHRPSNVDDRAQLELDRRRAHRALRHVYRSCSRCTRERASG